MENLIYNIRLHFIWILTISLLMSSCKFKPSIEPQEVINNQKLQKYLLRGWNTWNNSDLLSYVILPEGLSLKISFRDSHINEPPYYLNRVLINSPGEEIPVRFTPVAHSSDGRYIDCLLAWKDFEARIQVIRDRYDIMILYTPVRLPEYPPVLILETGLLWGKIGKLERKGRFIQAEVGTSIFSIGSTQEIKDIPLPISSLYMAFTSKEETGFFTGRVRSLQNIKEMIVKRKNIFDDIQKSYGNLAEAFNVIQSALSWNMTVDPFNHNAITPVSRNIAEKMGGWVMFNTDSYFTAALFAVDNKFHAYSNAITMTQSITKDGFVPNYTGAMFTGSSLDRSRAPVGSLVCNMIYNKYRETWFLKEVYDDLLTWNRWWDKTRINNGYLSWGSEPEGEMANTKEAAMSESDLWKTPYYNEITFNKNSHKLEIASVELMSLYISDCNELAKIAHILAKEDDKKELLQRAEKYSARLNDLWDEKAGIYKDKNLVTNQFCPQLSATSFYSLLSGVPDKVKAERMVREHLLNPREFFGDFMIPLISRNDPAFADSAASMYRILPHLNFLVYLGLKNYDFPEARKLLSKKSLDLVMKEWNLNRRIYENYNALSGFGSDIYGNDSFYTTGGLLALIPLMEADTSNGRWILGYYKEIVTP
jgi:putative isomerase